MLQFSEGLKEDVGRMRQELEKAPRTRAVNRVETWLVENQHSQANVRGHIVDCDEPGERGGDDTAPSPLEYMLASLGFCQQVMVARNAAVRGLALESVRVQVRGYFDRRGGHVQGVPNLGFEEIRLNLSFDSSESAETIRDLVEAVERECYAFNTLRRASVIRSTVTLNGNKIHEQKHAPEPTS